MMLQVGTSLTIVILMTLEVSFKLPELSVMLPELSVILPELSVMLLENIYSFIVQVSIIVIVI